MNKCILVGRLAKDPVLSVTQSGISVCRFTIAVDRRFTSDGEKTADFFDVIAWRTQADNCNKYLKKGDRTGVVGSLQNSSWEDKDGIRRYKTEVMADEVEFLQDKKAEPEEEPKPKKKTDLRPIVDPDLPF